MTAWARSSPRDDNLCDIVIPVWNNEGVTRACLTAIQRTTKPPFRVIVIDNGSEPSTKEFLYQFEKEAPFPFLRIRNEANLGPVKAANQGLRISNAPYGVILNNDTVVGPHWLDEMLGAAEAHPDIGIVNPNSNSLGRPKPWYFPLRAFSWWTWFRFRGRFSEIGLAHGFCMLIKRKVYEEIGALDEEFGLGYYEDFDYCRRAHKRGYRCVKALGAYVHHREHSSFRLRSDIESLKERNRALYVSRHGESQRLLYVLTRNDELRNARLNRDLRPFLNWGYWAWFVLPWGVSGKGLMGHEHVFLVRFPRWFFRFWLLLFVKVKKKKFHTIVSDEPSIATYLTGRLANSPVRYAHAFEDPISFVPVQALPEEKDAGVVCLPS
jgi:GT2 family glycosyltransferase